MRILVNGFGEARSEAQRAKVGGLKGRERCGNLGEGQPHQLGGLGTVMLVLGLNVNLNVSVNP